MIVLNDSLTIKMVANFLKKADKLFTPNLCSIHSDLDEYSKKIMERAVLQAVVENDNIVALGVTYCNDLETMEAAGVLYGVLASHQGKGYGRLIINAKLGLAKERGMQSIRLYTNNENARKIYESVGYNIVSSEDKGEYTRYFMRCTFDN